MYRQPAADDLPIKRFGWLKGIDGLAEGLGIGALICAAILLAMGLVGYFETTADGTKKAGVAGILTLGGILGAAGLQALITGGLLRAVATLAETSQIQTMALLRTERLIGRALEEKAPEHQDAE